jgi:2-polyprenyl-3-methyl-5-hydroxy-6-metoxy-1,4-benzoquinol methylase
MIAQCGTDRFMDTDMTQRSAVTLACNYGFESVEACADSLPMDARVLDAGAGAATFGHTIARMRPDIRWTNLDIGYVNAAALAALQERAPSNLTFVTRDVREAVELFPQDSFDAVFSYWLLNCLEERQARQGVRQLLDTTKPAGRLSVGALVGLANLGERAQTITLSPSEDLSFHDAVATHISAALQPFRRVPPLQEATYAPITGKGLILSTEDV